MRPKPCTPPLALPPTGRSSGRPEPCTSVLLLIEPLPWRFFTLTLPDALELTPVFTPPVFTPTLPLPPAPTPRAEASEAASESAAAAAVTSRVRFISVLLVFPGGQPDRSGGRFRKNFQERRIVAVRRRPAHRVRC